MHRSPRTHTTSGVRVDLRPEYGLHTRDLVGINSSHDQNLRLARTVVGSTSPSWKASCLLVEPELCDKLSWYERGLRGFLGAPGGLSKSTRIIR